MTTTLITGKGGTPHITSGDMGAMQAGIIGNGSYLLQGSDGTFPTVTMQDANHALIPVLNLVVEGRYARVTEAETATIESGMSGRNRNDLVCLKYTRNGQNIETAAIAVLKGTPNTGTAADPTVPSGSIHSASGTAWIPIARIPISGITPGTPVMLIKQLPPMSKLWDSVTLERQPFPFFGNVMRLQKRNGLVIATVSASPTSTLNNVYDLAANETIANGFRPSSNDAIMTSVSHGGDVASALIHPDGRISMFGTMIVGHHYLWQGVWLTE